MIPDTPQGITLPPLPESIMTKTTRRQHSPEFKLEAASLVVDQGYTRRKAAEAMGVDVSSIGRWIAELRRERGGKRPAGKALTPEQQRIQELEAKVAELELEKAILKKASALLLADGWKSGR